MKTIDVITDLNAFFREVRLEWRQAVILTRLYEEKRQMGVKELEEFNLVGPGTVESSLRILTGHGCVTQIWGKYYGLDWHPDLYEIRPKGIHWAEKIIAILNKNENYYQEEEANEGSAGGS